MSAEHQSVARPEKTGVPVRGPSSVESAVTAPAHTAALAGVGRMPRVPSAISPDLIMMLQRTVGNAAVSQLFGSSPGSPRPSGPTARRNHAPALPALADDEHTAPAVAYERLPTVQRVLTWDSTKFEAAFGKSKKNDFKQIKGFLDLYNALLPMGNQAASATSLVTTLHTIDHACTDLLGVLTKSSQKHGRQRAVTKNLQAAVRQEIATLTASPPTPTTPSAAVTPSIPAATGKPLPQLPTPTVPATGKPLPQLPGPTVPAAGMPPLPQLPDPQVPAMGMPPLPQLPGPMMPIGGMPPLPQIPGPTASSAAPSTAAASPGKQQIIDEVGLPESYLGELPESSVALLITAHTALGNGDLARADIALVSLRTRHGGIVNLLKSFLLRHHIGQVDPVLAKAISDPAYEELDPATIAAGTAKVKDVVANAAPTSGFPNKAIVEGKLAHASTNPKLANLTKDEQRAVIGYTSNAFGAYNSPLRSGVGTLKFGDEERALTSVTISGLNKMKPYTGRVFRHGGIFPGYKELTRVGATVSDMAFMSTAKLQEGTYAGAQSHDVLEILTSKSGREVSKLAVFAGEKEVLFKPGTQFQVRARYDRDPSNTSPDPWLPRTGPLRDEALAYWANDQFKDKIQHIIFKEEV